MSGTTIEDLEVVREVIRDIDALRQGKLDLKGPGRVTLYGLAKSVISDHKVSNPEFAHAVTEIDEQYHGYPLTMAFVALPGATSIGRQSSGQVAHAATVDPSYVSHAYDVCRALEEVLTGKAHVRTPDASEIVLGSE